MMIGLILSIIFIIITLGCWSFIGIMLYEMYFNSKIPDHKEYWENWRKKYKEIVGRS